MSQDPMTTILNLVQRARDIGLGEELYSDEVVRAARTTERALSDDGRLTNFGLDGLPWQRADVVIPGAAVAMSGAARVAFPQGGVIRHVSIFARTAPTGTYAITVAAGSEPGSFSLQGGTTVRMTSANISVAPGTWAVVNVTNAGGAEDVTITLHYQPAGSVS